MTQKEFEDRTGLTPTTEEFSFINDLYMECPTLDKNEFCKEFKMHGASSIITELWASIRSHVTGKNNVYEQYVALEKKGIEKDHELAIFLLGKAAVLKDPDLENKALELIPRSTAIVIKVTYGYPLNSDDLDYISKNLK